MKETPCDCNEADSFESPLVISPFQRGEVCIWLANLDPRFHIYSSGGEQTAPGGGAAAGVPTAHRVRAAQQGQLRPAFGAVAEWHWPVRAAKMEEEVRGRENVLGVSKADT